MGPTWGRQDPGGPHVGHMKLAIQEQYHKDMIRWPESKIHFSFDLGKNLKVKPQGLVYWKSLAGITLGYDSYISGVPFTYMD